MTIQHRLPLPERVHASSWHVSLNDGSNNGGSVGGPRDQQPAGHHDDQRAASQVCSDANSRGPDESTRPADRQPMPPRTSPAAPPNRRPSGDGAFAIGEGESTPRHPTKRHAIANCFDRYPKQCRRERPPSDSGESAMPPPPKSARKTAHMAESAIQASGPITRSQGIRPRKNVNPKTAPSASPEQNGSASDQQRETSHRHHAQWPPAVRGECQDQCRSGQGGQPKTSERQPPDVSRLAGPPSRQVLRAER